MNSDSDLGLVMSLREVGPMSASPPPTPEGRQGRQLSKMHTALALSKCSNLVAVVIVVL